MPGQKVEKSLVVLFSRVEQHQEAPVIPSRPFESARDECAQLGPRQIMGRKRAVHD